ncbi:tyrosine-protein kinase BAZ1B-like [Exaiptasia diaphana]|uniref:WHIM2 domain-containing protein n=1 Tax=Exaiptasia diaphana TaxID=2652724 RepID=A0A913WQC1_EXADI|nr:tyrosine-protein kinase BAZ1B-like [Exaiptasia diaphana]
MSSDAIDNFIEARYEEYLGLRRQKLKEEQEIRIKKKEEKEKEKNERIEKEKNEQEKKMSTGNNSEATNMAAKPSEESNSPQNNIIDVLLKDEKSSGEKNEEMNNVGNLTKDEPSELAKTIKNRRLQVELKKQEMEKKEKEQRERRLKEEEEFRREQVRQEHEDSITKFKASLRMVPLGYDRYHRRYWLFNGISGLFVEDGWMSFTSWRPETPSPDEEDDDNDDTGKEAISVDEDSAANKVQDDGGSEVITIDESMRDVEVVTKEKEENGSEDVVILKEIEDNRQDTKTDDSVDKSLRDVPYTWYYYDELEDIKALMEGFTARGIRESVLLQVLEGEKSNIEKNLKSKRYDLFIIHNLNQ